MLVDEPEALLTEVFEVTAEEGDELDGVGEGALDEDDEVDAEATDRDMGSLVRFEVMGECEGDEREQYEAGVDMCSIANKIRGYKSGEFIVR